MKINLSLQQDFQANELPLKRGQIKKRIETTLRHVGFDVDCEIGIACVDVSESQELNLKKTNPPMCCLFQATSQKKCSAYWMQNL